MLRRLAAEGFGEVPGSELETLAAWSEDWATASGEARYSLIAEGLREVSTNWGDQPLPVQLVESIEAIFRDDLVAALDADNPKDGAYFARRALQRLRALSWQPGDWIERGWVKTERQAPDGVA